MLYARASDFVGDFDTVAADVEPTVAHVYALKAAEVEHALNEVLDVIADHFLVDDNGLLCTNLYTSDMGDREGTEVYVMAPEYRGEWLNLHPIKTP